jgi:Ca2+-binding RTX toxin-like protein
MAEITGTAGSDSLNGTAGDDYISAGAGDDIVNAGDGVDTIMGGAGDDAFSGGSGRDAIVYNYAPGRVLLSLVTGLAAGDGQDTLSGIEDVYGSAFNDILVGNDEDNWLDGEQGADMIFGGGGNDYLESGLSFQDDGVVDQLDGGDGDDTVWIQRGDIAVGGAGTDTLVIDHLMQSRPLIVDLSPLWSSGTAYVGANPVTGFERLGYLFGSRGADIVIIGTSLFPNDDAPPLVLGYDGNDWLAGGDNRDWFRGGGDHDALTGMGGDDLLEGGEGDDGLQGGAGNDQLVGGPGTDVLIGGPGSDVYAYVNDVCLPADDRIEEAADEAGFDRIFIHPGGAVGDSAFAGVRNVEIAELRILQDLPGAEFVLGAEFQASGIATVMASADIDASLLTTGVRFIFARPNIRSLTVIGGSGDDVYTVEHSHNVIVEQADGGSDSVRAGFSFALPDHVETLILTGAGGIGGTGNGQANMIAGNSGANRLDGMAGADTMAGGGGHDTYVVDNAGDKVVESGSSGNDTVESWVMYTLPAHVEKLLLAGSFGIAGRGNSGANTITGNPGANFLNGGSGNDVIDAGAGNDRIIGSAGKDSLTGGAGADRFEFTAALGAANVDNILDFSVVSDTIYLMRSVFGRAGANGMLSATAFRQGPSAADASDRIVYDAASGKIFYDADGNGAGAAILFATVTPGTALTNADFVIYG